MDHELREQGLQELRRRAFAAKIAIGIFLLLVILSETLISAAGFGHVYDGELPGVGITRYRLVDILYGVATISSFVVVGLWIYQAHKNIHDSGYGPLEFTPGWAVGWFAVPVACLWKPFQAMREVWSVSMGEGAGYDANAPGLLWTWWIGWLLGNLLGVGAAAPGIGSFLSATDVVSAVALWLIIGRITTAQDSFTLADMFA